MSKKPKVELIPPSLRCPSCGFMRHLRGQFTTGCSEEVGRVDMVMWTGRDPKMTETRGPSFQWCGECGVEFDGVDFG
jgi:hypothetical protein